MSSLLQRAGIRQPGAYLARDTPFDVMLLSMMVEQQKQLQRLSRALIAHEDRASFPPSQRMAP